MAKTIVIASIDEDDKNDISGVRLIVQQNGGEYLDSTVILFDDAIDIIEFLDPDGEVCRATISR